MKSLKLILLVGIFSFVFGCNKEDYFGNFQDLNGNGTRDLIQGRYTPTGYSLYFFDGNDFDTNYIVQSLKSKPINPHVFDNDNTGFPNVFYWTSKGDKSQRFIIKNNSGHFEKPEEVK